MEGKCVFQSSKYLKFPYCTSIQKATILLLKHIHMDCVCMCVYVCTHMTLLRSGFGAMKPKKLEFPVIS